MLPCLHTFCLKCIETYGADKQDGEAVPCPMCRTAFNIPVGGLSKLNNNFFIEKLIASHTPPTCGGDEPICEVCSSGKQVREVAKMFCVECEENMCDHCSGIHKSMKATKLHDVKPLDSKADERNASTEICELHQEEVKFFCNDCKSAACHKCVDEKHNKHDCCDIQETITAIKRKLETDRQCVRELVIGIEKQSAKLEKRFDLCTKSSEKAKAQIKGKRRIIETNRRQACWTMHLGKLSHLNRKCQANLKTGKRILSEKPLFWRTS